MTPQDGYTPEEKTIRNLLSENVIEEIYGKLPTPRMKAVTALHFELGYDQEMLGKIFNCTQEQIALDVSNIRRLLRGEKFTPRKPRKTQGKIDVHEAISVLLTLSR